MGGVCTKNENAMKSFLGSFISSIALGLVGGGFFIIIFSNILIKIIKIENKVIRYTHKFCDKILLYEIKKK